MQVSIIGWSDAMLSVSDPEQLNAVLDLVHDWFFDIDRVRRDTDGTVRLPLARSSRRLSKDPNGERLLRIEHVSSIEIDDTEHIGTYDINTLECREAPMSLELNGGVPIRIVFRIHALKVSVENLE